MPDTSTARGTTTSVPRQQIANSAEANSPRVTPAVVSAVRLLHGDTAADRLIARAMQR